jgi:hypothetical protein
MRRALVLLAVAGGLAALFATASRQPPTKRIVIETSRLVVVSSDSGGCSVPSREIVLHVPGPVAFECHSHREAERFEQRLQGKLADIGGVVRGTRIVLP